MPKLSQMERRTREMGDRRPQDVKEIVPHAKGVSPERGNTRRSQSGEEVEATPNRDI